MNNSGDNRRAFLKKSLGLAVLGAAAPYVVSSQVARAQSANDRVKIACIGIGAPGGQGGWDAEEHVRYADILAFCDIDSRHVEAAKHNEKYGKGKGDTYTDYRRVLDRNDIDAVCIDTPDHWHVKIAIEALESGKHVFCQKPLTLTLQENQLIRNAGKKFKDKVFFVGTQQRSEPNLFLRAINMVQKGLLGDIKKVVCGVEASDTGGPFAKTQPPKELNWDVWLGQAPKVDYIVERCHHNFRWWYEYSAGRITDWGAHHVDIALWALGFDKQGTGPVEVDGSDAKHPVPFKDGYPTVDNCYNTSADFAIKCRFANGLEMVVDSRSDNGILFQGTKGRIFVNRGRITGTPIKEKWDEGKYDNGDRVALYKGKPFEAHKANFYRCIREGGLPVSDLFTHLQTMNVCHLCGIAARLGRTIQWDPKAEKIVGDEQAAAFFARQQRKGYEIHRV